MYTDKTTLLQIAEILIEKAQKSEVIYYAELAAKVGIENPRNLDKPLGVLSTKCKENGLPLISTVVINREDNLPGGGYFDIFGGIKEKDWVMVFVKELNRVHACKNLNDLLKIIKEM